MSRSRKKNPYRQSRAFDPSCRSHGGCPRCLRDRQYQQLKEDEQMKEELEIVEYASWDAFELGEIKARVLD